MKSYALTLVVLVLALLAAVGRFAPLGMSEGGW